MSNTTSTGPKPASRDDIHIAVICALSHEREAVDAICEHTWDPDELDFEYPGSNFVVGRTGHHFLVLSSVGDTGKAAAGILADNIKREFPRIDIALVVGVCGAMPNKSDDNKNIAMGDVIISEGVMPYDEGKMETWGFDLKTNMYKPDAGSILACIHSLKSSEKSLHKAIGIAQGRVREQLEKERFSRLREHHARKPTLHFGFVASGDVVVKNAQDRDMLAKRCVKTPIAFEMEGAGVARVYPQHTVIIKGVSDYADEEKGHGWQPYAALAAAAYMREFLDKWRPMTKTMKLKQKAEKAETKMKGFGHDVKDFGHETGLLLTGRRSRQPSPAPGYRKPENPPPQPVDASRSDSAVDTSMLHSHNSNQPANPSQTLTPRATTPNLVNSPITHGKVEPTPQSSPPFDDTKKDIVRCSTIEIQYPETELLFTACKARDVAKVRELLQRGQSDVSKLDENGKSMLHLTIGTTRVDNDVSSMKRIAEILTMLCEHKAERKANPNFQDSHGHAPIHYCAKSANSYAIQVLIRYKANINVMDKVNCTALNFVLKDRLPNPAFTKWFIERGAKAGTATLTAPRNPNQRQTQVFNAVWNAGRVS